MKYFLFVYCLFLLSCSNINTQTPKVDAISKWKIIDESVRDSWDRDSLIDKLGKANETEQSTEKSPETWIYYHESTGTQEWAFELNSNGNIVSVTYFPSSDNFQEFRLSEIKKRWGSLSCVDKKDKIVYPDFVKEISYVSCDNKKRYVEYNRYGEVASISIEK